MNKIHIRQFQKSPNEKCSQHFYERTKRRSIMRKLQEYHAFNLFFENGHEKIKQWYISVAKASVVLKIIDNDRKPIPNVPIPRVIYKTCSSTITLVKKEKLSLFSRENETRKASVTDYYIHPVANQFCESHARSQNLLCEPFRMLFSAAVRKLRPTYDSTTRRYYKWANWCIKSPVVSCERLMAI